jgi:CheY-like chemotaxis protein
MGRHRNLFRHDDMEIMTWNELGRRASDQFLGRCDPIGVVPYIGLIQLPDLPLVSAVQALLLRILGPREATQTLSDARGAGLAQRDLSRDQGKFLLVDDEPAICEVLGAMLEESGISCLVAYSAAEAISTYAEQQADISAVITDLHMSGANGVALATALRAMSPSLKIALMTGAPTPDLEAGLRGLGETIPVILKPFSKKALLDFVAALT